MTTDLQLESERELTAGSRSAGVSGYLQSPPVGNGFGAGAPLTFKTIVADPPWEYDDGFVSLWPSRNKKAKRALPYAGMGLVAIAQLDVAAWASPTGCNLFLWTTNRYLPFAFSVMDRWGFDYRQTLTWCKSNPAPWTGSVAPISTEFCLLGVRGSAGFTGRAKSSVLMTRRLNHSQKPDAFQDMVEAVSPGPYLELFARSQRLGWSTWGNECLQHIGAVAPADSGDNKQL